MAKSRKSKPTLESLGLSSVVEAGVRFETCMPVSFTYVRGTTSAPYFGSKFQQDIEPAGRYMIHAPDGLRIEGPARQQYEEGTQSFACPLVLTFNTNPDEIYGPTSWKARLRDALGAKGKTLSRKLARMGFDGIITVWEVRGKGSHTKEIVDIGMFESTGVEETDPPLGEDLWILPDGTRLSANYKEHTEVARSWLEQNRVSGMPWSDPYELMLELGAVRVAGDGFEADAFDDQALALIQDYLSSKRIRSGKVFIDRRDLGDGDDSWIAPSVQQVLSARSATSLWKRETRKRARPLD